MRILKTIIFLFVLILPTKSAFSKPKIVSVLTDHAWLAKQIGKDKVEVQSLLSGKEDPHHISARPSLILLASHADLYISPGMELDVGYTPLILSNSRNARIQIGAKGYVDASIYVLKLQIPQQVNRLQGDVHAAGNPHYTLDPVSHIASAKAILEGLIRVDPAHKDFYNRSFRALRKHLLTLLVGKMLVMAAGTKKLEALLRNNQLIPFLKETSIGNKKLIHYLGGWMKQMESFRGQKLLSYHRQWIYFLKRFGIESIGEIEPKPGIPPSAKHLNDLIELIRKEKPLWILSANYYSAGSARFLSNKTKVCFLYLPLYVHGTPAVKSVPQLFDHLIQQMKEKH